MAKGNELLELKEPPKNDNKYGNIEPDPAGSASKPRQGKSVWSS
jgi:hypothetical protein